MATHPTLFLTVGLPGAGKTTRAKELAAAHRILRLTPDEWMAPLFAESEADGRRDILEGRMIWVAHEVLVGGSSVILDFGCWSAQERYAIRVIAETAGADLALEYVHTSEEERRRRAGTRWREAPDTTFEMTDADHDRFLAAIEPPSRNELENGPLPPPPHGHDTWADWASWRWPTLPGLNSARNPSDDSRVEEVPDIGPVPKRLVVDDETVRQLVTEQFPQWAKLPIAPVRDGGWDNWTFHLGDQMLVRLPSAAEYALAVEKERRWLPELARQLPLPIPVPLGNGVAGAGYRYSWSIYGWLDGHRASFGGIADPVRFAVDVADFLARLRGIDATAGPQPGLHNWYRGGTLRTYDQTARSSLAKLADNQDVVLDVDLAAEVWSAALAAPWDGVDVWFHGDLAQGNLLLKDGQLAAVIDFGTCGVGDPACDLAIAWTLLTQPGRRAFRDRLGVDDAAWARGRGWALWKTLAQYTGAIEDTDSDDAAQALRVLNEIFAEYSSAR